MLCLEVAETLRQEFFWQQVVLLQHQLLHLRQTLRGFDAKDNNFDQLGMFSMYCHSQSSLVGGILVAQVATVRSYAVAAQELVQQSNMMKPLAPAKPATMSPEMERKHRRSPATFKGGTRYTDY